MVNKSMMRTHALGCHKRRALPAHSLAAAGLSLLLALSFPLTVRADVNLSTAEAIDSFYEKNLPDSLGNSDKFYHFSWSNNNILGKTYDAKSYLHVFSSVNLKTETDDYNSYEQHDYDKIIVKQGDPQQLYEYSEKGYYVEIEKDAILEVTSGNVNIMDLNGEGNLLINLADNRSTFSISDPRIDNDLFSGNIIIKKGTFETSLELNSVKAITIYSGNGISTNNNLNFSNKDVILNVRESMFFENYEYIRYEGNLKANNTNFVVNIGKNYKIEHNILNVNGSAQLTGASIDVNIDESIDTSNGYSIFIMQVKGDNVTKDDFVTKKNSIKIGSTIIQGTGFDQVFRVDYIGDTTSIYLDLLPSENGTIDGAKGISEGYLSGLMLTLQGADLVATRGMQAAMAATKEVEDVTFTPWATVSGSSVRYNTGAHADLNSFNMLTGIALGKGFDAGRVTVGAFFEYGTGSYKTSNSFDGHGSYDGKGDSYYLGWGLLARMDFADTGPGHFYVEGSGRMGGLYNNYSNGDLRDGFGREAEYDSYAPYYSFHAGLGYIWDINEQTSLEFYGKYLWTRECGDSVTLSTGEEVDFEDIDSSRLRFGTRLDYHVNEYITPYIGVAWEHEFDGESSATTNNLPILEPDLRGDTGIGEIGLTITPSENIPLTVDLGLTGYVGTREGISGSLLVKWTF